MEWQPIETAPKDGSRILGYTPSWEPHIVCLYWKDFQQDDPEFEHGGFVDDFINETFYPTHWMPLPEPPEK